MSVVGRMLCNSALTLNLTLALGSCTHEQLRDKSALLSLVPAGMPPSVIRRANSYHTQSCPRERARVVVKRRSRGMQVKCEFLWCVLCASKCVCDEVCRVFLSLCVLMFMCDEGNGTRGIIGGVCTRE